MTELQYLTNRVGILEMALSQLLTYELHQMQPYASERWHVLNDINQSVIAETNKNETEYHGSK
jgi:hypothetical protein